MNQSQFAELQNRPESSTLAGFEIADKTTIAETYCAMCNSDGGLIMVGVRQEKPIYGTLHWRPVGILADEEPGQVLRELEAMVEVKEMRLAYDFFPLQKAEPESPARLVLIIIANKVPKPTERIKIKGGPVLVRLGTLNVPESPREEIVPLEAAFGNDPYRLYPSGEREINLVSRPVIAPAGVPPLVIGDGSLGKTFGITRRGDQDSASSPVADEEPEFAAEKRRAKNDNIGDSFAYEPVGDPANIEIGGTSGASLKIVDDDSLTNSDTERLTTDVLEAEASTGKAETSHVESAKNEEPAANVSPARRLHGTQLQISREASESEEALNCEAHAKVLAAFFDTTSDDVCFGVFGHWGRGKTYLINKVSGILQRELNYEVIRFSAWKYRSTPEVWAHLYETAAAATRSFKEPFKSLPLNKMLFPYRAMLARYGIWPIIIAYLTFGFTLDTLQDRFRSVEFLLAFLGFSGTLYFLLLFFRLQGFWRRHGNTLTKQPSHRERLGLQMAIGDDLRALLIGWLPKDYWLQKEKNLSTEGTPAKLMEQVLVLCNWLDYKLSLVLPVVLYCAVITFVFFQLAPEANKEIELWYFGPVEAGFPQSVINLVYAAWGFVSVGFPLLALLWAQGPRKVLLIIDDLDRCEPAQMLEIIESVMLLLDDKEIQRRLQIVMLVEEEAVRTALLAKYVTLRSKNRWNQQFDSMVDDCIVRENLEKFFVSYLRLPEIPRHDFRELLHQYIEKNDGTPADNVVIQLELEIDRDSDSGRVPSIGLDVLSALDDAASAPDGGSSAEGVDNPTENSRPVIEYTDSLKLSRHERRLLSARLEAVRGAGRKGIRWGPRTVRSYLHKYRLARALWISLNPDNDFDAEALLDALIPLHENEGRIANQSISYIVEQVR